MLKSHIKLLNQHYEALSCSKERVTRAWVAEEVVTSILAHHAIDTQTFVSYYAAGVFDYFMQVVKGKVKLGHCPVMAEFLNYLKKQNIRADELFILCSHFKKAMIDATYAAGINTQAMFSAISYLFDANFSSVLRLYTDTIYQKELVISQSLSLLNEYKNAIDAAAIVSKTDTKGTITYVNENFCNICGYTQEALLGATHHLLSHPDTPESFYATLWEAIASNRRFQGTVKNVHKNGTPYYVDMTIVPLSDPMQGIVEYISIGYDVTKLVLAREEAYEASRAKEAFLSAMSHEIRTPLNAILGFVSVLESQTHSELYAHYLEIISHSGTHLLHLINNILDFSKIKHRHITIQSDHFHPRTVFEHLTALFKQQAREKGVHLHTSIDAALPSCIEADVMRIQQVVSNLISNAVKFTPAQGSVHVGFTSLNGQLEIIVSDDGIGIDPAIQHEIFKPFVQAHASHEGTGLGLAITQELVSAMGGSIELESTLGVGSTFRVTIPFETVTGGCTHAALPTKPKARQFEGRVLVAEDNADNLELLALFLKACGVRYRLVSNGAEAIDAFLKEPFDLVILDDEMPHLSGHETAKRLREVSLKTPIVMLSANATPQVKARALDFGCDDFLTKPIHRQTLETMLSRFLKPKRMDLETLAQTMQLTPGEAAHLLELFKTNLSKTLPKLYQALQNGHRKETATYAHKLKGSSANFHFEDLMAVLETLEQSARTQEAFDGEALFGAVVDALRVLGFDDIPLT